MKRSLQNYMKFRNWPVFWKISLMPILAVGLIMTGVFFYVLPLTKGTLTEDKRNNVADVVRIAYSIVAGYDQRVVQGEFALPEAQKRAIKSIERAHFGADGKGYIWINDSEKILSHPKTELIGKRISSFTDTDGKYVLEEGNKIVKDNSEGFIDYVSSKSEGGRPSPKIFFVKLYKPWGWIIGSGIYVDDVMQTVWEILLRIGVLLIIVSIVVTTTTFIVGGGFISGPVKEYGKMMRGFSSALSEGKGDLTGRLRIKSGDEIGMLAEDINKVLDAYGKMDTRRKKAEQRLMRLALYDSLTGLPNRTLFFDRMNQLLTLAKRNQYLLAVLYMDIDRFKVINDTLGHEVGDIVLQEASKRLVSCMRKSDTVARAGGDEFIGICPRIAVVDDAGVLARKIIAAFSEPFTLKGNKCAIGVSIGISVYPMDGDESEMLINKADSAMYRVKESGRGGYTYFSN
jgi:diguanylate cyclase (GGDEF)-like protein